jgi:hypothetical protein
MRKGKGTNTSGRGLTEDGCDGPALESGKRRVSSDHAT